ncbi:helix-turn-helix domain-containing protein [Aureimonas sp. AU20]|uniref:helix-turn-helix domain-containing protein n=1 Tax=Aureimonas sp. AU20 TaxID=1349819 RepID=UPI0007202C72|nr:helix-turn-helix domain-containing protein [Aureimonas sp. AU20]ALN74551.1 hypothetical protein M673_17690 [Aureimonas sp. AU20]
MNNGLKALRLSSDELGAQGAFAAWQASLPQFSTDLNGAAMADFRVEQTAWLMDSLIVGSGLLAPIRVVRTLSQIGDGYSQFQFIQSIRGRWTGDADGRAIEAEEGDTICFDTARPFRVVNTFSNHRFLVVPRDKLPHALVSNPALHGTVLRSAGNFVLAAHLDALMRCLPALHEEEAARLTRGTLAILTAALGEIDDQRLSKAETQPAQPALRLRVERYIEHNLASPELTPEAISRDLGIARSSLYRAFSPLGGISSFIQLRRLDTACALLFHPEEHRSVRELAETLGFENSATFSKAFRRRFGCSPREARGRGTTQSRDTKAMFERWQVATQPPQQAAQDRSLVGAESV